MKNLITAMSIIGLMGSPALASPEENKATAARVFEEKMGRGDFSHVDEIYGLGFVAHSGGQDFTLEQDNASGKAIRAALPDLQVRILRLLADGSFVTVYWEADGTNSVPVGAYPGEGKRVSTEGMTIFRFMDGRIVEEWSITDQLRMLQQLGFKVN